MASSPPIHPSESEQQTAAESTATQKIGFMHMGCSKNLVDTENMLGLLAKDGHTIVADENDADLVMVNTCAFIEEAQKESVEVLVDLANRGKRLMITGCLAQKFQGELLDLFPEADAVVGINDVPDIANVVKRIGQGERVLAMQQDPTYILEADDVRHHITMGAWTYVKIAEGCDHRCSFCIIPSMRGDFRSRTIANVVNNVKSLVEKGVREVVLVGQDTTYYGRDTGESLPQLLRALNEVEDLSWIRFMYAYPSEMTDELLDAIAECDKVVKYLDCPLQHTHPDILKRMKRPVYDTVEFCQRVRERVPNIKLRTSLIVGFPGETEEHFEHMAKTIQEVRWDRLGVFEYSDVDTAHSKTLDQKVPKSVIKKRRNTLMEIQQQIAYEHNQELVGQVIPTLVEYVRPTSGLATGRTQWDAPEVDNTVTIANGHQLVPGDIVPVRIASATPYDLKGMVD